MGDPSAGGRLLAFPNGTSRRLANNKRLSGAAHC